MIPYVRIYYWGFTDLSTRDQYDPLLGFHDHVFDAAEMVIFRERSVKPVGFDVNIGISFFRISY